MSSGEIIPVLSTTNLLLSNSSWTTPGYSTRSVDKINIILQSDVNGTLVVNWSVDEGYTYNYTETYHIDGGAEKSIPISLKAPTIRLTYTNGSVSQSSFYLYTYGVTPVVKTPSIAPSLIESLVPYDTIRFNSAPPINSYFVTGAPLPQDYYPYPTIDSYGGTDPTQNLWKLENNSMSLYPSATAATAGNYSMVWGVRVTPGSSVNMVEFQATYNGLPVPATGPTATTQDSIGYGIPSFASLTGSLPIRSGIVLGNIQPYAVTGGFGHMAITTYNTIGLTSIATSIRQYDWDDPILWVDWTAQNFFRFIITPSQTACQIRLASLEWKTFHTLYIPFLTLTNTSSGRLIMMSENINASAKLSGCSCQSYYTYILDPPAIVDQRSLNGDTTNVNTEKILLYLYNNAATVLGQGDIVVKLKSITMSNQDNTNIAYINIYRNPVIGPGPILSPLQGSPVYYGTSTTTSFISGTLQQSYLLKNNDTINVEDLDILIQPGQDCAITGVSVSAHLFYALNWEETQ